MEIFGLGVVVRHFLNYSNLLLHSMANIFVLMKSRELHTGLSLRMSTHCSAIWMYGEALDKHEIKMNKIKVIYK